VKHFAPLAGDDGSRNGIPLSGVVQVILERLTRLAASPRRSVGTYAALLAVAASSLAVGIALTGARLDGPLWAIALLALFALAAEQQPVRLSASSEVTVSLVPVLFAAVAFGPLAGMLVGAAGLLGDARRPYARWVVWMSSRSLAAGLAGLAALGVGATEGSLSSLAAGVLLAFLVDTVIDTGLATTTIWVRGGPWRGFLQAAWPITAVTVPLYAPVMVMLVFAYHEVSVWTILLFFAPAFAAHSLYRLYREQRTVADELTTANRLLAEANISFAGALVAALDARDRYTAGHSAAVAVYARDIASHLRLSDSDQSLAYVCGLVHDIGKVGLPPGILEKAGPLTPQERAAMEEHPAIGERILSRVANYSEIARVVRHHHERLDGRGYPDGLASKEIPLLSRIIAVADAYNAMTSARPYRDAMPSHVALFRLRQDAGTQFAPDVVAAFGEILQSSKADYAAGNAPQFGIDLEPAPAVVPLPTAVAAAV
jgi:putative nucleotidyltransferase with HDIG domain